MPQILLQSLSGRGTQREYPRQLDGQLRFPCGEGEKVEYEIGCIMIMMQIQDYTGLKMHINEQNRIISLEKRNINEYNRGVKWKLNE